MTVFEKMKMENINELVDWLDEHATHDNSPWYKYWDERYCNKCESIKKDGTEFAWCEVHGNCRFFKEMKEIPDNKQMIKMWLESECD